MPTTDSEYTPQERRAIDVQFDAADKGPFHGPFGSVDEMIASGKGELKKHGAN